MSLFRGYLLPWKGVIPLSLPPKDMPYHDKILVLHLTSVSGQTSQSLLGGTYAQKFFQCVEKKSTLYKAGYLPILWEIVFYFSQPQEAPRSSLTSLLYLEIRFGLHSAGKLSFLTGRYISSNWPLSSMWRIWNSVWRTDHVCVAAWDASNACNPMPNAWWFCQGVHFHVLKKNPYRKIEFSTMKC